MDPQYWGLTLLPESPVSDKIEVDLRVGLTSASPADRPFRVSLFLDSEAPGGLLHRWDVPVSADKPALLIHRLSTAGLAGSHRIIAVIESHDSPALWIEKPLEVLARENRSTGRIDGAFAGFYHWSEEEGRLWNRDLAGMTGADWREMLRAMRELDMNLLVPQEAFRNQEYVGRHAIPEHGYHGKAFYPSALYPGRMPIACADPLECVLAGADELGMGVFLPVGMYAWFDFTKDSLDWHLRTVGEMWKRYGHHPSVYGFYVSEEVGGDLGTSDRRREELVVFFREFTAFVRRLAPDKPVMLATNCHGIRKALEWYPRLLANLDILCPFAFQRMPVTDLSGEEAAETLQRLCDDAGSHLWMDMEAFNFHKDGALYPRPFADLVDGFHRFPVFEKVICYQFPGLFSAPWARIQPGGPDTVQLFDDYRAYLASMGVDSRPAVVPSKN